jgi:hypothetical protein
VRFRRDSGDPDSAAATAAAATAAAATATTTTTTAAGAGARVPTRIIAVDRHPRNVVSPRFLFFGTDVTFFTIRVECARIVCLHCVNSFEQRLHAAAMICGVVHFVGPSSATHQQRVQRVTTTTIQDDEEHTQPEGRGLLCL